MDSGRIPGRVFATMHEIRFRTSLGVCFLPVCFPPLEMNLQYRRKPARCQRTTVSGVTRIKDWFQPGQIGFAHPQYPENPDESTQFRTRMTSFRHYKLLVQGQVFEEKAPAGTKQANERSQAQRQILKHVQKLYQILGEAKSFVFPQSRPEFCRMTTLRRRRFPFALGAGMTSTQQARSCIMPKESSTRQNSDGSPPQPTRMATPITKESALARKCENLFGLHLNKTDAWGRTVPGTSSLDESSTLRATDCPGHPPDSREGEEASMMRATSNVTIGNARQPQR